MQDIRIERWAHTLVHYCLNVQPDEMVAVRATPLAAPLVEAVYSELLRAGAYPLPLIELESFEEILLKEGNIDQLLMPHPVLNKMAEHINAQLSIGSKSNTKSLSGVEPSRLAKRRQASQNVARVLRKREQLQRYRWATTLMLIRLHGGKKFRHNNSSLWIGWSVASRYTSWEMART